LLSDAQAYINAREFELDAPLDVDHTSWANRLPSSS